MTENIFDDPKRKAIEARLHQDICEQIRRVIQQIEHHGIYDIPPGLIALKVCDFYCKDSTHPCVRYGAYEHCKRMAQQLLAEQAESRLQERYPIKTQGEPVDKPLHALTEEDVLWNFERLHKDGALQHAYALLDFCRQKFPEQPDDLDEDGERSSR